MMSFLFMGSELDEHVWDVADRLKKDFTNMMFVKTEDANGLLDIHDNDVILFVAPGIDEPAVLKIQDLKNTQISNQNSTGICSFLLNLERIGRVKEAKVILIPEQADETAISGVCKLLTTQKK
jgi:hypothetical protein